MCCAVTWRRLSAVPGASPINKKPDKEGKQSAAELLKRPKYEWNSADWEVLPNISSFYHLSPDACNSLCKAITQISEAAKALCDTKQMPSVILYLQFLGEMKWGNAALLTWYAHADICFPSSTHTYTCTHTQVINLLTDKLMAVHVCVFFLGQTHRCFTAAADSSTKSASSHLQLRLALFFRSIKISKDYPCSQPCEYFSPIRVY